jgi:hypothetical protein
VGSVEYAHITEDDGYLGAGLGGGGGLQLDLTDATSIGVEISRTRHVRDVAFHAVAFDASGRPEAFPFTERWERNATWLFGTISHAFGRARARPSSGAAQECERKATGISSSPGVRPPRTSGLDRRKETETPDRRNRK